MLEDQRMATKIAGETYRGEAITLPLSQDGQVSIYVWPCRTLNVNGMCMGGPTIGVDVGNAAVIRYDCPDTPGHSTRNTSSTPVADRKPISRSKSLRTGQLGVMTPVPVVPPALVMGHLASSC